MAGFLAKNKKRNAEPKYAMHSLELVFTVLIFFGIGRVIDSVAGTAPTFTLIIGVLGILGSFASAYYRYILASQALDADKAWEKEKTRVAAPVIEEEESHLVIPEGYGSDD